MKSLNAFVVFSLLWFLQGCSVVAIQKHSPNYKTTREVRTIKGTYFVYAVGSNNIDLEKDLLQNSLPCRLTTFNMPANKTIAAFIKDAINSELDAAEKMQENGREIEIEIQRLESDTSSMSKGFWHLAFIYHYNKKSESIVTTHEFESAFAGDVACRNTAHALSGAIEENFIQLVKKLK